MYAATIALAEIARARRTAGLPGLNELQAATLLRELADIRALPESATTSAVPSPRRARPGSRMSARWWAFR